MNEVIDTMADQFIDKVIVVLEAFWVNSTSPFCIKQISIHIGNENFTDVLMNFISINQTRRDVCWWWYLGEALTKRWRICMLQFPCHSWAWHLPARRNEEIINHLHMIFTLKPESLYSFEIGFLVHSTTCCCPESKSHIIHWYTHVFFWPRGSTYCPHPLPIIVQKLILTHPSWLSTTSLIQESVESGWELGSGSSSPSYWS